MMVNACYDLLSEGLGVVPYACVGLGGNFVGVVDGHITPKLARSITNIFSTKPPAVYQLYVSLM
ncbi:surface antigen family protein [Anaplasma phagocytophilum str. CRT53-1]|uniref:Surface antigen family protein n=1 Tax=Anaplasma phagocytophilum str. CRT53-1 TaxID=1359157 RepID=A0A0F3PP87_ANAPH|nr:surface antigen family protein [Anaplasma phagocytophilum str. CRT53-1]